MKKRIGIIAFVIIIAALISAGGGGAYYFYSSNNKTKEAAVISNDEIDLTFGVVSDIHNNDKKFEKAINYYYSINKEMDALILNGDSVDQGVRDQYDNMKKVFDKNKNKLPDTIIKNIGNHEYYNYSKPSLTNDDLNEFINGYLDYANTDKIYHDTWVKGYHFISLGSDNTGLDKVNYTTGSISDDQINFLKEALQEKYEKGKPIFVFLHQPIDMEFFSLNVKGVDKNDEIKDILQKYPEVILFSSHSHLIPNDFVDKKKAINTVNTGSINSNYVMDPNSEKGFKEDTDYSNGIYVEVKDFEVTIKAINFLNNSVIYERKITN